MPIKGIKQMARAYGLRSYAGGGVRSMKNIKMGQQLPGMGVSAATGMESYVKTGPGFRQAVKRLGGTNRGDLPSISPARRYDSSDFDRLFGPTTRRVTRKRAIGAPRWFDQPRAGAAPTVTPVAPVRAATTPTGPYSRLADRRTVGMSGEAAVGSGYPGMGAMRGAVGLFAGIGVLSNLFGDEGSMGGAAMWGAGGYALHRSMRPGGAAGNLLMKAMKK